MNFFSTINRIGYNGNRLHSALRLAVGQNVTN